MKNTNLLSIDHLGVVFAVLVLRIWLGVRSCLAGIEKYAGQKLSSQPTVVNGQADPNGMESEIAEKIYSLDAYAGVPKGLYKQLDAEPFIMTRMLDAYDVVLGPLLILLGIGVLVGLATRLSLLGMGLVYTSLTFGLILLNQSAGVAWLGTHIVLIVLMLIFANRNQGELGTLLARHPKLQFLLGK